MVDSEHIHEVLNALNRVHPYETPAIDIIPLENSIPPAGLGIWGELPETVSFDQFARHVRTALKRQYIRMAANGRRMVKQVAVLGGAGGSRAAHLPPNVEVYVTGDIGYHDALLLQERGIAVVDAGHDGTESGIVPVIAGFLKQRFKSLRITAHPESELFQVMAD